MSFRDRRHAGRALAVALAKYTGRDDVLVLGLPRGGVPVAFEVARALRAPLDVFLVRKLGVPQQEELAMGAIASGGVRVLNEHVVRMLGLDQAQIDAVTAREQRELERRERAYRDGRAEPAPAGRTVIVVDDGLATGASMRAAVQALRAQAPARVVVAVPVGAGDTCRQLRREVDEVVCLRTPEPFGGVGIWYDDFSQTEDGEVRALLAASASMASTESDAPTAAGQSTAEPPDDPALAAVRRAALPVDDDDAAHDALLRRIGDATLVLIGEASHGTEEFYRLRAGITRRLIAERGFTAVAAEADWPDAYRVNRYVRGQRDDADADAALSGFRRFPAWMWRNTVVRDFVAWLRAANNTVANPRARVGFYGLDLYSLHTSMEAVLAYLRRTDPAAAERARQRYACFDHYGDDTQAYGYAASFDLSQSCEDEVVAQLVDLRTAARSDGDRDEELFFAEQNALLVRNAEAYYRSMFRGRVSSWNLRDRHMMETLQALVERGAPDGRAAKIVVWAHNSHLGDARATRMGAEGELNLGQLVRECHGDAAVLVGFSTYRGTVTAASSWEEPAHRRRVRPGLAGSCEALFHATGLPRFQLDLRDPDVRGALRSPRLQRAIGVVYRPGSERQSHYFEARLADQFDWLLHIDETHALVPLEPGEGWHHDEPPETWPSGY
jgi:erythromycin esterase-like protein/predicted phosphoribosyltransferase